jgi:hypothetical protein
MAADQDKDPGQLPVDPLLGQPRMVDDPRISVAQGAVVLGKKPAQVHPTSRSAGSLGTALRTTVDHCCCRRSKRSVTRANRSR